MPKIPAFSQIKEDIKKDCFIADKLMTNTKNASNLKTSIKNDSTIT